MTDSDLFFEFIVVIIELGAFMITLILGTVIWEVVVPRLMAFLQSLNTRVKSPMRNQHIHTRS